MPSQLGNVYEKTHKNTHIVVKHLGLIDYHKAWAYQNKLFQSIIDIKVENRKADKPKNTPNYLLFCEHPPTFTLGRNGKEEHLLLSSEQMKEYNVSFVQSNRGGDITYHGPGQIVVYPILDLDNFSSDVHIYLRTLEQAVINTLAHYNLVAGRIEKLTGVWLSSPDRKICAMGIRLSRWVSMHGLALNVNADLNYFKQIVPCGIDDKAVTSMQKELNRQVNIAEVSQVLEEQILACLQSLS